MSKRWIGVGVFVGGVWLTVAACSNPASPSSSSLLAGGPNVSSQIGEGGTHAAHATDKPEDKGYLDGWFEGDDVQLYYTKSYYCAEPPSSGASSDCEIGAPPPEQGAHAA